MGFFDKIGDVFGDIGEGFVDILSGGGLSKKKAAKRNARALERAAGLNALALRVDADTQIQIAEINKTQALKDAVNVLRIGELNAEAFEANAEAVELATQTQLATFGLVSRRQIGLQKASFGASGIRLEGSPLVILAESERIVKNDIRNILLTGRTRVERFLSKANITREEAALRHDRFMEQSDQILFLGQKEAERLRRQADITLETGQSQAQLQRLRSRSLIFEGLTQTTKDIGTLFILAG